MSENEYAKIIGKNLKRIMYDAGKTQIEVAKDLNISKATISSWMNGTRIPRMDKIDILCNYFNVSRADIMEEKTDQDPKTGQVEEYYLDTEAREAAEFLHKNPEYKVLFDASRKVKKEDIEFVRQFIERMS